MKITISICFVLCALTLKTSAYNVTIGILVYVYPVTGASGLNRPILIFQQLATSILLAIHHINTRNDTFVGSSTVSILPETFRLKYKIADTHSQQTGAVKALLNWRCQQGAQDYTCNVELNATLSAKSQPLYEADKSDQIKGIIGPFRSEESVAVCNLASALGMKYFPVLSYASVLTDLSDKIRFPYFSRTVPSLGVNAVGITQVFKKFGWTRCALMYIDDPWGNSFANEFLHQAGVSDILVLISVKFRDRSASDIQAGVKELKASGARIFVYLEDTGSNLESVLLSSAQAGIAGQDGYAWVTFEQNDPEVQLNLATTPAATLRPLLYGWLNILGYAPQAAQLARFQRIFAAADRAAVYSPVVDMPEAGFANPLLTAYHLYAYDSVWATALGLAGGPDAASSNLVDRIRASAFLGASGPVAFDNVTGDRLSAGLHLRLQSIGASLGGADFAAADWSSARLSLRDIGYFEDAAGFVPAAGAFPAWPGGRVSWTPPADGTAGGGGYGALTAAVVVPILVGIALAVAGTWWACRREDEDEADRRLRAKVAELRAELGIERADGYLMGGERPPLWARREPVGYLRRGYVEAAARLALCADFDVKSLDALCVSLLGDEFSDSDAALMFPGQPPPGATLANGEQPHRPTSQAAYGRLCEWLLRVSEALLDPGPPARAMDSMLHDAGGNAAGPNRVSPEVISAGMGHSVGRKSFPGVSALMNQMRLLGSQRCNTACMEEQLSLASDPGRRFAYFADKVSRLQVWREDASLFRRLKGVAQRFMDEMALACDGRYAALVAAPGGAELDTFSRRDFALSRVSSLVEGYDVLFVVR